MKVVVTFNNTSSGDELLAEQLVRDALFEFLRARSPVEEYVAERYKHRPDDFRARRQHVVTQRVRMAHSTTVRIQS